MKNKVIASILLGSMLLAGCSSTKPTKNTKNPNVNDPTSINETDATKETGDIYDEVGYKTNYLLDKIDKDEIYTIIDGFYLGDPQKGENVQAIYDRVTGHINKPNGGYTIFGYRGSDIIIEFANTNDVENDGWWINGRDNVCAITYSGYQIDWDIGDKPSIILGNREIYTKNHDYPAGGGVYFHIYDEARAKQLYDILCGYIDEKYSDLTREVRSEMLAGYAAYLPEKDNALDYQAAARMFYNEEIKCWEVIYAARFASIGEVDKDGNPVNVEETKTTDSGDKVTETSEEATDDGDAKLPAEDKNPNTDTGETTINPDEDGVAHT